MWFNPSELSKTKKQTSANLANPANWEEENTKTAPPISKLAELAAPLDLKNDTQRSVIKPNDQQRLLDYMAAIGETDQSTIDALLTQCANDADALNWVLSWANQLLPSSGRPKAQAVNCRGCRYFKSYNTHGGGAGQCGIGARSAGHCQWANDLHQCNHYLDL